MKHLLFKFDGRISRSQWWKAVGIQIVIMLVAGLLTGLLGQLIGGASLIFVVVAYAVILWAAIATGAKRMHDHGKSGWFQAWGLIPLVGFYTFALAACMRGNVGPNAYGNDPVV